MRLLLTFMLLLFSLTACATSDIYLKRCAAQGGEWTEGVGYLNGCNHPVTGANINVTPYGNGGGSIDPFAAMILMQGMQGGYGSRPVAPLTPVPIQPLAHTCFNSFAGNQIISQCY